MGARIGVWYDSVGLDAATRRGVVVTPGANDVSVAEHALTLLMALAKQLLPLHAGTAGGGWPRMPGTERRASPWAW